MTVAAAASGAAPDLAAVARSPQRAVGDHQVIGVVGRHADADVVPGPADQPAIPAHVLPALAAVVGAPDRALRLRLETRRGPPRLHAVAARLNQRVHPVAIRRRDGHVGLAVRRLGQAGIRDLRERLPAVVRDVDAAARPAALEHVRLEVHLPRAGEDDVGILLGDLEAGAAGVLVDEEHVLPGLAAVLGSKHAPLLLRTRRAAQRADEHDVLVLRIDGDRADAAGLLETHVRPGLTGVGRFVDAVAHHVHVADGPAFAGAGPHHVRIRLGDRERADGLGALRVERRLPAQPAVARFPHPARGRACVIDPRLAGDGRGRGDAARALRPRVFEVRGRHRSRGLRALGTLLTSPALAHDVSLRTERRRQRDGGSKQSHRHPPGWVGVESAYILRDDGGGFDFGLMQPAHPAFRRGGRSDKDHGPGRCFRPAGRRLNPPGADGRPMAWGNSRIFAYLAV